MYVRIMDMQSVMIITETIAHNLFSKNALLIWSFLQLQFLFEKGKYPKTWETFSGKLTELRRSFSKELILFSIC